MPMTNDTARAPLPRGPLCEHCGRPLARGERIGDAGLCSAAVGASPHVFWYRRDCETARAQYTRGHDAGHEVGRRSVVGIVERMIDDEESDERILRVIRSVARGEEGGRARA